MSRVVTEVHEFTRKELEVLGKSAAKSTIIGRIYYGQLGNQVADWMPNGSLRVFTYHTPDPAKR